MCPYLFGFIDTYTLLILVGVAVCFIHCVFYMKKIKLSRNEILDILIVAIFAILMGVIFACLFQNFYDFISDPEHYSFSFGLTFYGGLFGGVIGFLLLYFLYYKKRHHGIIKELLIIAPGCITIAHAFGRIGCFLAGCCYGRETDSWLGMYFPHIGKTVYPTQLYEAIFLFILSAVLLLLAYRKNFKYTFPIYMVAYGIWRFLIEFVRGDYRGAVILGLYPSQFWCIVLIVVAIPFLFIEMKIIFPIIEKKKLENNQVSNQE